MEYLNQNELKRIMLLSCEKIEENREQINKINVFPVPDQDTGDNLVKTLEGIKEAIKEKEFKNLTEISEAALDGALTAAQGNAGVIYTGFLAGFLPLLNKNPVDAKKLAIAFEKGAKRARKSIQNPKEGTILDVIDAASQTIKEKAQVETNIINILKAAVEKANEALIATQEKMEILRKAKVVDAGGLGFLLILESHLEALEKEEKPSLAKITEEAEEKASERIKRFVQILSNRYEIVALIKNPKFDEKIIREKLKKLGNCLDIVQVGNKMKIHIHTDYPDETKDEISEIGEILKLKTEDMARGIDGLSKKVSIGIVTDELADLTQKIVERYQIEVIPYKIDWPEEKNLSGENIYQKMIEASKKGIKNLPKTSQASPKEFLEVFKKQLGPASGGTSGGFDKILCILISSKLSGGYNSAIQAREMLPEKEKEKVYVLDSLLGSAGQALLVLRAIELIQGERKIYNIISELKRTILNIYLYGFFADPKWIEWGGRVSYSQANWIRRFQKFGIRTLIGVKNGKIEKIGLRFGVKDISEALFKEIEIKSKKVRRQGKKIRVVITHCDNLEAAEKLKEKLKEIKAEVSFINLVGSVVGVHIGPGTLMAAWTAT